MLPSRTATCAIVIALTSTTAATVANAACDPKRTLGVSRTVTLDTTGGKLYGGLQYKSGEDILDDKEVILTFDDGPLRPLTRQVLEALSAHCTKATFFMVGRMAVADPAMVREVEKAGHTIANHTWSHKNLSSRSGARAGGEIELGISAVQHAATKPIAPFFRFPYLADPNGMIGYLKGRDFGIFSIDIDAYDYRTPRPERVYATIMSQLRSRGKGIMLFHDIQRSTAGAMRRILDDMHRDGYKIVHIVPAKPAKTLPEFDTAATELHEKRRTVASAPAIDGGRLVAAAPDEQRVRREPTRQRTQPPPAPSANAVSVQPAPEAVSRPRPLVQREPDWRQKVLGN